MTERKAHTTDYMVSIEASAASEQLADLKDAFSRNKRDGGETQNHGCVLVPAASRR